VQRLPENGTTIGHERRTREQTDPVLPGSAAIGDFLGLIRNQQVIGSSPIAGSTNSSENIDVTKIGSGPVDPAVDGWWTRGPDGGSG